MARVVLTGRTLPSGCGMPCPGGMVELAKGRVVPAPLDSESTDVRES